jgi:hypothetical protein
VEVREVLAAFALRTDSIALEQTIATAEPKKTRDRPMQSKYDHLMESLHNERMWPDRRRPVTRADIREFEAAIGYPLPLDYAEFLLKFGVTHGKDGMRIPDSASVEVFYGLDAEPNAGYSLWGYQRWETADLPPHCLPIASGAGGVICLCLASEGAGSVYWFDPHGGEADPSDDAILLAEDFDTFLRKLVVGD